MQNVMKDECTSETHIESEYTGPSRDELRLRMWMRFERFEIMVEDASKCTEATCGRSKPRVRTQARSRQSTWIACAIVVKGARVHILYTICFVRGTWRVARGRRAQKCSKTCARNPRDRRTTKTSPRISIATVSASEQVTMNTLGSLWVLEMRAIRSDVEGSTNACENGMEVVAHYTGSAGGSKAAIALSREEAAGVAVSLTLVALALLFFFGYRCYQRRYRGYHWHTCEHDDDESGVTSLRQKHGCELCANTNTNDEDEDDFKKVAVVVSKGTPPLPPPRYQEETKRSRTR